MKMNVKKLPWTPWIPWKDIQADLSLLPTGDSHGVYEVRFIGQDDSFPLVHIGKAHIQPLGVRVACLIKGQAHSTGKRIVYGGVADGRTFPPLATDLLEVRWARTERASDAEEELHEQYRRMFNNLPLYDVRGAKKRKRRAAI